MERYKRHSGTARHTTHNLSTIIPFKLQRNPTLIPIDSIDRYLPPIVKKYAERKMREVLPQLRAYGIGINLDLSLKNSQPSVITIISPNSERPYSPQELLELVAYYQAWQYISFIIVLRWGLWRRRGGIFGFGMDDVWIFL
jgi:hypothetical protein